MSSDQLEKLLKSIIPLSSLPNTRKEQKTNAPNASLPPLVATDRAGTISRMQQDISLKAIDKLTERIGALVDAVNDAKNQVLATNGKMNGAMDQTIESTTAVVNRSQERILTAVGQPAQQDVIRELLDSSKTTSGMENMVEKLSAMQASQSNLQATLLTVMSQAQQISAQVASVEQNILRRMDDLASEVATLVEENRKRQHEDDLPTSSKRRKLDALDACEATSTEYSLLDIPSSTQPARQNNSPSKLETGAVLERHISTILTPPVDLSQISSLTTSEASSDRGVPMPSAESKAGEDFVVGNNPHKAQKLASFFGDVESPEEGYADDLFSRFEDL